MAKGKAQEAKTTKKNTAAEEAAKVKAEKPKAQVDGGVKPPLNYEEGADFGGQPKKRGIEVVLEEVSAEATAEKAEFFKTVTSLMEAREKRHGAIKMLAGFMRTATLENKRKEAEQVLAETKAFVAKSEKVLFALASKRPVETASFVIEGLKDLIKRLPEAAKKFDLSQKSGRDEFFGLWRDKFFNFVLHDVPKVLALNIYCQISEDDIKYLREKKGLTDGDLAAVSLRIGQSIWAIGEMKDGKFVLDGTNYHKKNIHRLVVLSRQRVDNLNRKAERAENWARKRRLQIASQ
ncbi:hypothetical protein HY061_02265 [Candidatus Azambacteria bacterium]|nr:hypothetical protein [Candidatus Azambacteria bacterium]